MNYLRNTWYMAAWSDEVRAEGTLARTLLDEAVVLFRDSEGCVQAVIDRCCHRFAPLSRGKVQDGILMCGYHGLCFDGSGACVSNPHGPVTKMMSIRAYPVREAYRAIWIWMGDPELADSQPLPALDFIDQSADTAFNKGYTQGHANYQLYVDNILDLTHTDYLHPDTLGGGANTRTEAKVSEEEGAVLIKWNMFNELPWPLIASMTQADPNLPGDSWLEVTWNAPAVMVLRAGIVAAGQDRSLGVNVENTHIMTPESAKSTHYFYASTRDFRVDDAEFNELVGETRARIFSTEDKPMLDAQQKSIGDAGFWELGPRLFRTDIAPVKVRRTLDAMIAKEQQEAEADV